MHYQSGCERPEQTIKNTNVTHRVTPNLAKRELETEDSYSEISHTWSNAKNTVFASWRHQMTSYREICEWSWKYSSRPFIWGTTWYGSCGMKIWPWGPWPSTLTFKILYVDSWCPFKTTYQVWERSQPCSDWIFTIKIRYDVIVTSYDVISLNLLQLHRVLS